MKKDESHHYYEKKKKTSFSLILAGILRAGKRRFLENLAVRFFMSNALYPRKSLRSACTIKGIRLIFCGKTSAAFPDRSSIPPIDFYVNQTDRVLNFPRGHTSADDVCILKCIFKHRILQKIRATFLSLSEEEKVTSAGLKR